MATGPGLGIHRDEAARVRHIAAGDEDAFRELVVEYHALAYSLAYKALSDRQDAEEVVQDAFVKIHGAVDSFRGEASLKTWILRIVWRLSLNRRRDRSRSAWQRLGLHRGETDTRRDLPGPSAEGPEAMLLSGETQRQVRDLIDGLPPALREVIILNSFEELGYEEIARVLQIPVGTVSSRIHNARRRMAEALRRHDLT